MQGCGAIRTPLTDINAAVEEKDDNITSAPPSRHMERRKPVSRVSDVGTVVNEKSNDRQRRTDRKGLLKRRLAVNAQGWVNLVDVRSRRDKRLDALQVVSLYCLVERRLGRRPLTATLAQQGTRRQ
jgi:hypothetical protein